MQYDDFVGQVQHKARMASSGEAVRPIRATLTTLGERLYGGEPDHLAAQLPREIGAYLTAAETSRAYDLQDFLERIAEREEVDYPEAVHHARAVIATVNEAASAGVIEDVLSQLPDEFAPLFEAGSEGSLNLPG